MEVSRWIFAKALVVTLIILVTIYSFNVFLNSKREISVTNDMDQTVETLEEMEALTQTMQMFGENATCVTLRTELRVLDKQIWTLGEKIESYQKISEEYMDDPYYIKQKKKFNRQEVLYLSLLSQVKRKCDIKNSIILYFYGNWTECQQCDQQAYVLNHIGQKMKDDVSIFSFDTTLGIPSVDVLVDVYGINSYPCLVIDGATYCGLRDKAEVEAKMCERSPELSICGQAPG
jgi:hypothetical protein